MIKMVKISEETLKDLKNLKETLECPSLDKVIKILIVDFKVKVIKN